MCSSNPQKGAAVYADGTRIRKGDVARKEHDASDIAVVGSLSRGKLTYSSKRKTDAQTTAAEFGSDRLLLFRAPKD